MQSAPIPAHSPERPIPARPISPRSIRDRGRLLTELADYVSQPALASYTLAHAYWHAHLTYARRAALLLSLGELHPAQVAAEVSTEALACHRRHGGTEPIGPGQPVV